MKAHNLPVALLALLAISIFNFSQPARAQERELGTAGTVGVVATATVKAIDPDTRTVTLETADGETRTIRCSREAANFDQVKVGDQVKAVAMERYVVAFGRGTPRASEGPTITRAPKGDRPGMIISNTEEVAAKIDSLDPANQMITLQGADGKKQSYKLLSEADLSGVKPGDQVTVQVTSGLALWVERPQDAAQPAAGTIKPGEAIAAMGGASATFTVEAIDAEKRIVTLKPAEGESRMVQLGKEAINFDQIQVGDQVKATLAEEVAIAVSKGGAPPSAREGALVARAPRGSKPSVIIAETALVTGKIQSVDADKHTITMAGVDGKPKTVKAGPKVDLSQLKAGDDVTARVTAAMAIVVEKP